MALDYVCLMQPPRPVRISSHVLRGSRHKVVQWHMVLRVYDYVTFPFSKSSSNYV